MARLLRIEWAGGRHHVAARGIERRAIVRDDRDRRRFVELPTGLPDRFGIRVHGAELGGDCGRGGEEAWGRWEEFRDTHGDWGQDAAHHLDRYAGRMRPRELAEKSGGLGIAATGQAVSRTARRLAADKPWTEHVRAIESHLSKSKT